MRVNLTIELDEGLPPFRFLALTLAYVAKDDPHVIHATYQTFVKKDTPLERMVLTCMEKTMAEDKARLES